MIAAIIQVRLGSSRLPRKVLLNLEGKTVLEHVISRVRKARTVEDVIVATTVNKEDLEIVKFCSHLGISVYCGSEIDVLDRFYQTARLFKVEHIVRVTSDCPVIDPFIIDKVVTLHKNKKADYTANVLKETFPDGQDVEVFTFETLEKAWKNARLLSEREHVTPYIRKHKKMFKLASYENRENLGDKRWTLDEQKDYKFIKILYENLYKQDHCFGMEKIINFLNKHPDYQKINNNIVRNEGYLISFKKDAERAN